MSSPIVPIPGRPAPSNPASSVPAGAREPAATGEAAGARQAAGALEAAAFGRELAANERALAGKSRMEPLLVAQENPEQPPSEVLEQIAAAGRLHEQLRARGLELRFSEGPQGVLVELCDAQGQTIRTLSIAEAMDIATGRKEL